MNTRQQRIKRAKRWRSWLRVRTTGRLKGLADQINRDIRNGRYDRVHMLMFSVVRRLNNYTDEQLKEVALARDYFNSRPTEEDRDAAIIRAVEKHIKTSIVTQAEEFNQP